jgi:hypothetical protein
MIILSSNIRGVGGPLKLASFRRLLSKTSPNIIFLQETLVSAEKSRSFMIKLRPDWCVCAVSAVGTSGGLLVSWDPSFFDLVPYLCIGGILLSGFSKVDKRKLSFLNLYGPCQDRKVFWEALEDVGLLSLNDLILAGDLNLITSSYELWGLSAQWIL